MTMVLLKIVVALATFGTAILGISDLKSLRENKEGESKSWYQRITKWGSAKIVLAAGVLLFGAIYEKMSADASSTAKEAQTKAELAQQDLQKKVDEAKALLVSSGRVSAAMARVVDLLDKSTDKLPIVEGAYFAAIDFPGIDYPLKNEHEKPYLPLPGDRLDYVLYCIKGELPPLSSCENQGYGRLLAGGDALPIEQARGYYFYKGDRSNPAMNFEAPTDRCASLRKDLQDRSCRLSIQVTRARSRDELRTLHAEGYPFAPGAADPFHDDLCKAFTLLYEQPCP